MRLKLTLPGVVATASCMAAAMLCLSAIPLSAQESFSRQQFRQDPLKAAVNLHCYEPVDSSVTAPPKGYKPFYISHIGRHGSRAHGNVDRMKALPLFEKFNEQGLLTPQAQELLKTLVAIRKANEDLGYGALTSRGVKEHAGIARRMANHYPEVFSNKKAPNVSCYSTRTPRVIFSMNSFTAQLGSMHPELNIFKQLSKKGSRPGREVLRHQLTPEETALIDSVKIDDVANGILGTLDCSRLVVKTFKDGKVPDEIKGKEAKFFRNLHLAGCNRQCFEDPSLGWVEPYFTPEELVVFGMYTNTKCCYHWSWTDDCKGIIALLSSGILKCIIEDADAVIAGADTCATLRFSHDGHILPLLSLMRVKGCDFHGNVLDAGNNICLATSIPMGGNIQFIFFRNGKGKVLVKLVHNDAETTIPALKPKYNGVFYDWEELKAWFFECMKPYEAFKAVARDVNVKGRVCVAGIDGSVVKGIPGVLVSDGVVFTQTDSLGHYAFKSDKKNKTIFVVTPSGYVAESADGLQPSFWKPLKRPANVCETLDFRMVPQDQKSYSMLFIADMHLCNAGDLKPDMKHFEEAILPLLQHHKDSISALRPVYLMNLGDLSHDRYWYEFGFNINDAYKYLCAKKFPGPMYSVTGNHDHDPAIYVPDRHKEEFLSSHLYRKVFGPDHYSFNAGGDHWIVMNDAQYLNTPGEDLCAKGIVGARNYAKKYTQAQLRWLEKDLSYVPDGSAVYLCSHIPPFKYDSKAVFPEDVLDKLEAIFAARNIRVTLFAGHSHRFYMSDSPRWPHIRIYTLPASSGNMWETAKNGRSINLGGSIAGLFYATFDGAKAPDCRYVSEEGGEQYYRAYDMNSVRKFMQKDSLMKSVIPQLEERFAFNDAKWKNVVAVNCWWYRTGDTVQMWEDGKPLEVKLDRSVPDPLMFSWILRFNDPMRSHKSLSWRCHELIGDSIFTAKTSSARKPVHVRISCADGKVFDFDIKRPLTFDRQVR